MSVSEQKRPLLLPQEVKELGRDRELLLYEGLRPILAWKNRYFEDPVFKKRLFPPPLRATPAGSAQRSMSRPTQIVNSVTRCAGCRKRRACGPRQRMTLSRSSN